MEYKDSKVTYGLEVDGYTLPSNVQNPNDSKQAFKSDIETGYSNPNKYRAKDAEYLDNRIHT